MAKEIPLTKGKVAIVDDEDYDYLIQWNWRFQNPDYAAAVDIVNGTGTSVRMHRVITGAKDGEIVDHINRNGLDNRRANLRICNHLENSWNRGKRSSSTTSKYKGVHFNISVGKYQSSIKINGKTEHLGCFVNEIDAAYHYNKKAEEYFGEYAVINDIPKDYVPTEVFSVDKVRGVHSKYIGVTYDKRRSKYVAQIKKQGKSIFIGYFGTERVAAEMYNVYAIELHGDKARLNTFEKMEGIINE